MLLHHSTYFTIFASVAILAVAGVVIDTINTVSIIFAGITFINNVFSALTRITLIDVHFTVLVFKSF